MHDHFALAPAHKDSPPLYLLHRVTVNELVTNMDILHQLSRLTVHLRELLCLVTWHN